MTRKEAIASYEKLYAYMVGDDDVIELDYGKFMELNHYIRSALRSVSREQVEKVWRGEWVGVPNMGVYDTACSRCGYCPGIRFGDFDFCPNCGAPMTDEAVDMMLKRMEEIYK